MSEGTARAALAWTSMTSVNPIAADYSEFGYLHHDTDTDSNESQSEKDRSTRSSSDATPGLCQNKGSSCIVDFEGVDDPLRPLNWTLRKKVGVTALYGLLTTGATWATSSYAPAISTICSHYNVSGIGSSAGVSLFLFGFGLGPLLWAPLSEAYGRKLSVLAPYFVGIAFTFGTGAAKDIQTIFITRFFAGFFSSAPVSNTGGVLSDMFVAKQRGAALAGYSIAVAGGPPLAAVVGGAIINAGLSWRWTQYLTGILMSMAFVLGLFLIEESDPNCLLTMKARRLRLESGNWALHAKHEEWNVSFKQLAKKHLILPLRLSVDPICFLLSLYASFVYAILYLTFTAFPFEFSKARGWNPLVSNLPFLSTLLGHFIGMAINVANTSFYAKRVKANAGKPVPEARLPPMMLGGVAFATGIFLFGWTSQPDIHWIGPVFGACLIGLGFLTVFQASLNYLIDTFQATPASAIASNTVIRCMLAGAAPLFAVPLFENLGIEWASSLIGFVAVALIPIPFLFYVFGRRIRARGELSRQSTL